MIVDFGCQTEVKSVRYLNIGYKFLDSNKNEVSITFRQKVIAESMPFFFIMSVIFSLSWLQMAGFQGDNQVKSLIFQSTKEMPLVLLK